MSVTDPSVFHADGFAQDAQDKADQFAAAIGADVGKKRGRRHGKSWAARRKRQSGGSKVLLEDVSEYEDAGQDSDSSSVSISSKDDGADEGPGLEACMDEWKRFHKQYSSSNQRAMALCCEAISQAASKAIKQVGSQETGAFLARLEPSSMRMALVFGGDDVSDNEMWIQHLCAQLERACTPHIAVLGAKECVNSRSAIQSLAVQLKASLDEESQRLSDCDGNGSGKAAAGSSNMPMANAPPNRRRRVAALRFGDPLPGADANGIGNSAVPAKKGSANLMDLVLSGASKVSARRSILSRKRYDMHDLEQIFDEHFMATNLFRRSKQKQQRLHFRSEKCENKHDECQDANDDECENNTKDKEEQQSRSRQGVRPSAIVLFEDAANIDPTVLQETLVALSSYHTSPNSCLRFAAVAGLQGGNYLWNIDAVLRRREMDKFRVRRFRPADAKKVMDSLFESLILDCKSPLRMDHRTARWISDSFLRTDSSMRSLMNVLHLAVADHFARYRSAFVSVPADVMYGYDVHPLSSADVAEMMRLRSVRKALANVSDTGVQQPANEKERRELLTKWIRQQQDNKLTWPHVFKAIRVTRTALGVSPFSSLRAEFNDITDGALLSLRKQLGSCPMESLDLVVKALKSELSGSPLAVSLPHVQYERLRLENTATAPPDSNENRSSETDKPKQKNSMSSTSTGTFCNAVSSAAGEENGAGTAAKSAPSTLYQSSISKSRVGRKQLRQTLSSVASNSARDAFLKWWDRSVILHWDGRRLPLGELFFCNQSKLLNATVNSQPRTVLTEALASPENARTDVCLAFQIMSGHRHTRSLPLLAWYSQFCAAVDIDSATQNDPRDDELKARFMQACAELELLGFCSPASNAVDSVKILVHTDTRVASISQQHQDHQRSMSKKKKQRKEA